MTHPTTFNHRHSSNSSVSFRSTTDHLTINPNLQKLVTQSPTHHSSAPSPPITPIHQTTYSPPILPSNSESSNPIIHSTGLPFPSLHEDFQNLSLNPAVESIQSPSGPDLNERSYQPTQDHPSDSDSTSTSHHPPSISAFSTNEDPSSQSTSNSSHNLFHQQPPSLLKIDPPSLSPPQSQSHHPRPHHEILNDISTLTLNAKITEVALSIQEVALALFQVQELRHSNASSNIEPNRLSSSQTSPSILATDRAGGSSLTQVDKALIRLEKKVQTTAREFSELEPLISPHRNQDQSSRHEESSLLTQRFDTIVEEWQRIQADTQILQDELKEDKWLVVFRAVSIQAEEMMSSLEKVLTISQEFVRETLKRTRHTRPLNHSHNPSNHTHRPIRNPHESLASSTSSLDHHENEQLLKSFHVLSQNFHAKNKHYVPSCQRVLGILSKGITSRRTKNGEVLRRYADMNVRFTTIQEMIEKTELELVSVHKILQHHSATLPSDLLSPTLCSIQVDDFSHLQPPPDHLTPRTPSSSSDSKARKALSSMSNYIMSTSPKFFAKQQTNGLSNSISPFKKLASKFTGSTASVSSQPSSISSMNTPPTLTASTLRPTTPPQHQQQEPQPQTQPSRPLRSFRSTLDVERNPSITRASSRQVVSEERPGPSNFFPTEQHRARPNSRQTLHNRAQTPSSEKPRWNISLKRIEDTPSSHLSYNLDKSTRRVSHQLTSSQPRMVGRGMRASTPSMMNLLARRNQQYHSLGAGFAPDRPGSVAGRSDASCVTTLSTNLYRSRPPSRHSKIPAPLWDPGMQAQRARSKGSLDLQELARSHTGTSTPNAARSAAHYRPSTSMATTRNGLFSPTSSDIEKMPTRRLVERTPSQRHHQQHTRRTSRNSVEPNHLMNTEQLESLIETLELEERLNPADPLDKLIHAKCQEKGTKILARRIDPHLINNGNKLHNHGISPGKGELARYSFWLIGMGKAFEEKSVVCKLVESCSKKTSALAPSNPKNHQDISSSHLSQSEDNKVWKVLVKSKTGWMDLDSYLNDLLAGFPWSLT